MHTEIGFERFVIHEHALLGHVAQLQGRDADAATHHDEAIQRARRFAMPLPLVVALEASRPAAPPIGATSMPPPSCRARPTCSALVTA